MSSFNTESILENPRTHALNGLKNSVSKELWERNTDYVKSLQLKIKRHSLTKNPIIKLLNEGKFDLQTIKTIHLEYRHAIVQIFTDALLMAQFQARQLEPRLHSGSKMIPRFLLTLNTLDEFGFQPGLGNTNYYRGNPSFAHYPLFEKVLNELQISETERQSYIPSPFSIAVRNHLESCFENYLHIIALLAVAEEQVILFSPPLRQASRSVGINVDNGYYHVHGTTSDSSTDAADDEHEDDLLSALIQGCTPSDYSKLDAICLQYCELWNAFWNHQNTSARLRQEANTSECLK